MDDFINEDFEVEFTLVLNPQSDLKSKADDSTKAVLDISHSEPASDYKVFTVVKADSVEIPAGKKAIKSPIFYVWTPTFCPFKGNALIHVSGGGAIAPTASVLSEELVLHQVNDFDIIGCTGVWTDGSNQHPCKCLVVITASGQSDVSGD